MPCASVSVGSEGGLSFTFTDGTAPRGRRFKNTAEWDEWQRERMEGIISGRYPEPEQERIKCMFTVLAEEGAAEKPVKVTLGLSIRGKKLAIASDEGETAVDFDDISAMSMVKTNRLLYTTAEGYYELKCKKGCLRRVLNAWQAAKRLAEGEENDS